MLAHPFNERRESTGSRGLRICWLAALLLAVPAAAQVSVPGTANIYGAGHEVPPAPGGYGAGVLPTLVSLPAGADRTVSFTSVTGMVDYGGCCPPNEADGVAASGSPPHASWDGIAGPDFSTRARYLTGVFLSDLEPADPAPDSLVFTDGAFTDLSPGLHQVFFIGDGLTGEGTGVLQSFHAPAGATRLFLGFLDRGPPNDDVPGWYGDNSGVLTVAYQVEVDLSSVGDEAPGRRQAVLMPNEPNPFNPATRLSFELADAGHVRLRVHDIAGRLVATLMDERCTAGRHQVVWRGRDAAGHAAPAGVYLYRLRVGNVEETRSMVLIR